MPNSCKFMHRALLVSTFTSIPCAVYAGGFGITVQSATGGGNAATGHALAEDASAMWYNPALLSSLEGSQINGGLSFLYTDIEVTNTGSTIPTAALGLPVIGDNTSSPGGLSVTPSVYYKRDIRDNLAFGLGLNAPFGVSSEYNANSFVRYEATETGLKTLNINPALAWRLNEKWDLGAGLNVQVGQATLDKALDSFLVCRRIEAASPLVPAGTCANLGLTTPSNAATDGAVSVEADGVGFGVNIGAVFRPDNKTTLSLGYRSPVEYDLKGDAKFTHNAALLAGLGTAGLAAAGLGNQDAEADLEMPASVSLAFARQVNEKVALHGDVTWTEWSSVPEVRIKFPDTTLEDSITDTQWENTTRVGAGLTYKWSPRTTLRSGIALDPTPTPNPRHRTPRAPSSDNLWFSGGLRHQINNKMAIDASFSYVHPEDASMNYTAPGTSDYTTRAETQSDVWVGAVSVNYKF